jgi:hypothetical protein
MLIRTFEPKRKEVTGEWKRSHKEELLNMHPSSDTYAITSMRMRWVRHVASNL